MKTKLIINSYFKEVQYRFFYITFSFCLTFLLLYLNSFDLFFLLVQPFFGPKNFIFTDLPEAFSATLQISVFFSFYLIIPLIFYHFWAFFIPGFFQEERKKINTYFFFFFFCIFVENIIIFLFFLPKILFFLLSFEIKKEIITIQLEARIQSYINFTFTFYFFLFFLFQIPLILFTLFKFKIINITNSFFYRKYFYFFAVLLGSFLSPPDLVYQLTIAFFFFFIYEISLWLNFFYEKNLN